ncbi:hypothetical protein ACFQVA_03985 [Actinomadura keratinilytica]
MLPLAWVHRDLPRRRPALLLGFGLLAVAGVQACYFAAISRIPVGVALLVEYLARRWSSAGCASCSAVR